MARMARLLSLAALLALLAPPARADEVVVNELVQIPKVEEEIVTPMPSGEVVWVPGNWERRGDQWVWTKGRWERPPRKEAHWRKGQWAWEQGEWHWVPGHWAVGRSSWMVDEIVDVPTDFKENKPPQPSADYRWVSGHWDWDGAWFWVSGYWTNKPKPEATWVAGRWLPYGTTGKFWWLGGHWAVK
jgi:hypothetical protein